MSAACGVGAMIRPEGRGEGAEQIPDTETCPHSPSSGESRPAQAQPESMCALYQDEGKSTLFLEIIGSCVVALDQETL